MSAHVPRRPTIIHSSSARSAERDRAPRGERVVGGQRRVQHVVHQPLDAEAVERRVGLEAALLDDREVDVAAAQGGDRLRRVHQLEVDLDARPLVPEGRDRERHDRPRRGRERGHAQAPARARRDLGELGLGVGELGEDALGVAHERLAGRGQAHALGEALDQLHAGLRLEPCDLLRDGGLRVGERVGGGGEGAAQRHLAQDLEQAEIIHKARLSRPEATII